MKKFILFVLLGFSIVSFTGCANTDANVISERISTDAEMFKINRRIVFYNGITGEYMLTITGLCSIVDQGDQLEVTCKTGFDKFKKHFLGLSDNVTYFAEQIEASKQDPYHYKVIFKPSTIVPDIEVK